MAEPALENPVLKDGDAEEAALLAAAEKVDAGEMSPEAVPSVAKDPADHAAGGPEQLELTPEVKTDNLEALPEPARDELGRFTKADGSKSEPNETAPVKEGVAHPDSKAETAYERAKKDQERLNRNRQEFEAEKAREREQIRLEREAIRRERQQQGGEPNDFTSAQYDWHAKDFERKAELAKNSGDIETAAENYDLSAKARVAADQKRQIEHNQKTEEAKSAFETTWKQNMEATIRELPDLATPDTPLAKQVVELFKTDPVFNYIPDGFRKASTIAQWKLGSEKASGLEVENKQLKAELQKYQKFTSLGGSSPTRHVGTKRFEDMTVEEMERHLERQAELAGGIAVA